MQHSSQKFRLILEMLLSGEFPMISKITNSFLYYFQRFEIPPHLELISFKRDQVTEILINYPSKLVSTPINSSKVRIIFVLFIPRISNSTRIILNFLSFHTISIGFLFSDVQMIKCLSNDPTLFLGLFLFCVCITFEDYFFLQEIK